MSYKIIINIIELTQLYCAWTEGLDCKVFLKRIAGVKRIEVFKRITGACGACAASN